MLLGVFGVAASNYFYYLAIQRTNVAIAIIVQYTAPVWVLLYMVMRGLQRATAQRVIAVALALTGIVLVIGIVGSGSVRLDTIGVIAAMLAAFSFAFYNVAGTQPPGTLRSLDGAALRYGKHGDVLDHRESSVEDCGGALFQR